MYSHFFEAYIRVMRIKILITDFMGINQSGKKEEWPGNF